MPFLVFRRDHLRGVHRQSTSSIGEPDPCSLWGSGSFGVQFGAQLRSCRGSFAALYSCQYFCQLTSSTVRTVIVQNNIQER